PDLLTLRAAAVLRTVPVLAAPCRADGAESLAGRIAAEAVAPPPGQERLLLTFPMTRDAAVRRAARQAAAGAVADRLARGLSVAFVTEGDPTFYSSFLDLLAEAPRRFPEAAVEIVPGVTSLTAVAAAARLPLADGDDRLAVLPAARALDDLPRLAASFEALVLVKAAGVLPALAERLDAAGLAGRAVLVSDASTGRERVHFDLAAAAAQSPGYFSTVLVRCGAEEQP
ncbi:MAG TPA: precorrin-2 C(20)-methyltransferase, partial [Anaeromyxobacteraceae bacterium]|nr:precorrin-2 C(20)-methyltransferase [Anaeromyxobacteraceae bacterium]